MISRFDKNNYLFQKLPLYGLHIHMHLQVLRGTKTILRTSMSEEKNDVLAKCFYFKLYNTNRLLIYV